jgi:hypothetical protein
MLTPPDLCIHRGQAASDFRLGAKGQSKVAHDERRRRVLEMDLAKNASACHNHLCLSLVNGGRITADQDV